MSPCHIHNFLKNLGNRTNLISLELCTNRIVNIPEVIELAPAFCSVTWLDNKVKHFSEHPTIVLSQKLIENDINVLMHLPGRIYNQREITEILTHVKDAGIKNILAVQGERALGESKDDFPYASDLVKFVRGKFSDGFCIGVTGYPVGHPNSPNLEEDLIYLKQKVDSGADFIITQAVFDSGTLHDFYKRCRNFEINVPIIPGLFIINSYSSLMKMVQFCKLHLPDNIMKFLNENKDSDNAQVIEEYGIKSAIEAANSIFSSGEIDVNCIHIFTLNELKLVRKVLNQIKFVH